MNNIPIDIKITTCQDGYEIYNFGKIVYSLKNIILKKNKPTFYDGLYKYIPIGNGGWSIKLKHLKEEGKISENNYSSVDKRYYFFQRFKRETRLGSVAIKYIQDELLKYPAVYENMCRMALRIKPNFDFMITDIQGVEGDNILNIKNGLDKKNKIFQEKKGSVVILLWNNFKLVDTIKNKLQVKEIMACTLF